MIKSVLALALVAGMTLPASAQMACTKKQVFEDAAKAQGMTPVVIGEMEPGYHVIIYSTADGDKWLVLGTRPDGVACKLSDGVALKITPLKKPGKDI